MSAFPGSRRLLKGAIIGLDPVQPAGDDCCTVVGRGSRTWARAEPQRRRSIGLFHGFSIRFPKQSWNCCRNSCRKGRGSIQKLDCAKTTHFNAGAMHLYEAHPRKDKRDFDLIAFSINQPT
jgi:hypothetical protein